MSDFRHALIGLAALLILPSTVSCQEREVVSKEISVGRTEAALRLELSDGGELAVALRGGSVLVDGSPLGSYASGDGLDAAWRALLGEAVMLDDGPLARMLVAWSPPADLEGDQLAIARQLDAALERALSHAPAAPTPALVVGSGGDASVLRLLLEETSRLPLIGRALQDLDANITLHLDEDVVVGPDETLAGSLIVVDGDARIAGTVEGDVVMVDGVLEMAEGGRVLGDVRLVDASLVRDGGSIGGEVVDIEADQASPDVATRELLRDEIRDELRDELRRELRGAARSSSTGFFGPFARVFRGIGGLIENLVAILVMGILGVGILAFAPRNLETVAEVARRSPGRAATVGVAGMFLLIPVWILGAVALAVTIVGIPVAIAWLPLFPVAAVAAAILGYLAVARNLGEWLSESGYRYTDWISPSNAATMVFGGVVALMGFFIAANVLGILPFFGFFKGLLTFVGVMATAAAVAVGFGAVLLTRAGRQGEYHPRDFDDAWERAAELDLDADVEPAAGRGPEGGNGHA